MTGAGLLGEINIPDLYNISAVEHSITSRSLRNISKSFDPGRRRISTGVGNGKSVSRWRHRYV